METLFIELAVESVDSIASKLLTCLEEDGSIEDRPKECIDLIDDLANQVRIELEAWRTKVREMVDDQANAGE
jgi:hypothetical protein